MHHPRKIYRFKDFIENISRRNSGNIKYDLDRIHLILNRMGNPEKKLRGFHIGGTNGKGSISAMCEALCLSHDWQTGMNTSPHLIDYRERFRINGKNITAGALISSYNSWSNLFEETEASFFEITTAIAFDYFSQLDLHTSIFEVGLGGRLDATNPFKATVSIISSISIDHPQTLGDTIEKIAFEKAGIIKKNVPLVLGQLPSSALEVISRVAREREAPVFCYGRDFQAENVRITNEATSFDFINRNEDIGLPERITGLQTNLVGNHQALNTSIALSAFALYCQKLNLEPDLTLISKALTRINWRGRMQIVGKEPLTILDCAHNEEGIISLVSNLKQLFPGKRLKIILAILRDKNIDLMISALSDIAGKLYISRNNSDRAANIEEQTAAARKYGLEFSTEIDINSALDHAVSESGKDDIIIVTGSIYTVSEIIARSPQRILKKV
jgi:dihydrofolate synthase/folylpolyglutamate synthase